jgi:hypothetical protein
MTVRRTPAACTCAAPTATGRDGAPPRGPGAPPVRPAAADTVASKHGPASWPSGRTARRREQTQRRSANRSVCQASLPSSMPTPRLQRLPHPRRRRTRMTLSASRRRCCLRREAAVSVSTDSAARVAASGTDAVVSGRQLWRGLTSRRSLVRAQYRPPRIAYTDALLAPGAARQVCRARVMEALWKPLSALGARPGVLSSTPGTSFGSQARSARRVPRGRRCVSERSPSGYPSYKPDRVTAWMAVALSGPDVPTLVARSFDRIGAGHDMSGFGRRITG